MLWIPLLRQAVRPLGFYLLAARPQIAAGERISHACFVLAGLGDCARDGFVVGDAERQVVAVSRDHPVEPVDGPAVCALVCRQPQLQEEQVQRDEALLPVDEVAPVLRGLVVDERPRKYCGAVYGRRR